jgi:hypothetical protein
MPELTPLEIALKALSHPDNGEPITADWLNSIGVYGGDRDELGPTEHESIIMVTKGEKGADTEFLTDYLMPDTEVTAIGLNLESMRTYIETWDQEVIILLPIATRLEFRLLLLSLKAWGYRGE